MAITRPLSKEKTSPIVLGGIVDLDDDDVVSPSGYLLLETGDKLVLEDASGNLLLEG